jgi:hypothetical protein
MGRPEVKVNEREATMKRQLNFVLMLALGAGTLGTMAAAQENQGRAGERAQLAYATYGSGQSATLQQVDWNDRRRCDGDHDRDDRGCYAYNNRYPASSYYGNGYYAAPHYAPRAGWYDRDGRWHAYDRDRDRDRRRHDDDDRR